MPDKMITRPLPPECFRLHIADMRALVVEDETRLRKVVVSTLREEDFAVDHTGDGEEGLYKALNWEYDVILLDIMLPKLDGWEVLSRLREVKTTPVLMLTARDGVADRVNGLNIGADDYLPKPFDLTEMVARVRAITRRSVGQPTPILRHGDIEIDTSAHMVRKGGEPVDLKGREFAMAALFVRRADKVISREYLSIRTSLRRER